MRPPAPNLPRIASQDIMLGDTLIPKDTMLVNFMYGPMMDPKYWKDPLTFNPDRY